MNNNFSITLNFWRWIAALLVVLNHARHLLLVDFTNVDNKNILIVDDLIDTGGTFVNAAQALRNNGAKEIFGACTHPVLSGKAYEQIEGSVVKKVVVTDTLPLKQSCEKIQIHSIAHIFAEAILRTHRNESISSLFDIDKDKT